MAVSAVIGALRIDLGLNSASFRTGMDTSESRVQRFSTRAKVAFAAVGTAIGLMIGALGRAGGRFLQTADDMGKLAQRAGVSVESMSRLAYAGSLADVEVETLANSLAKLSKNMADIASGKGGAAKAALDALGISATNLDGTLRAPDQVLADIAEKLAAMPDSAQKTALAIGIFGRAGAQLIPLLNEGRIGLGAMADEADRLGKTISTETAKSAEEFNDNMTRLNASFTGIANKIMVAIIPALEAFSNWLVTLDPQTVAWGAGIAAILLVIGPVATGVTALATAAGVAAPAITALAASIATLTTNLGALVALPGGLALLAGGFWLASTTPVGAGEDALVQQMNEEFARLKEIRDKLNDLSANPIDVASIYEGFVGDDGKIALINDEAGKLPVIFDDATDSLTGVGEAADVVTDELSDAADEAETLADRVGQAFKSVGSELKGLISGAKSWNDVLITVLGTAARIAFQSIDYTGGGTNGVWGDVVGGLLGGLFGFAAGGSFKVGGAGGIDSQPVAFMASPDEVVSVMTPAQQKDAAEYDGGRNVTVNNTMNISTPDVRGFKQSEAQISGRLALATRRGARTL